MSRLAENLVDIFKVIAKDDELLRLLYYPTNPLDPSKTEVKDLVDFIDIRRDRIVRAPKTNDLTNENICRVCMYFGNRDSLNRLVADQDVVFDVYAHIDTFEINESRTLKIIDKLSELLNENNVTGIGKVKSDRMYIIGNSPSGYIGYKVVFTFGSGK